MSLGNFMQQLLCVPITLTTTTSISTTEVSTLSSLLKEYGTEVVIVAVFIIILAVVLFLFLRMFNKLLNNSISENKKILDGVLKMAGMTDSKENNNKKETESHDKKMVSKNVQITKILDGLAHTVLDETKCNRIGLYVFHNGNGTPYGYRFIKMSCIFDRTIRGITSQRATSHQSLPIHAFSTIIDSLIYNGEFCVSNVYSHGFISANEQVVSFIYGTKIKALFCLAIKDKDDEIAAFLVSEYEEEQDFTKDSERYNVVKNSMQKMVDVAKAIVVDNDWTKYIKDNKEEH